jgi:MFS family permease
MRTEAAGRFDRLARVALRPPLGPYLAGRFLAMTGAWVFRVAVGWTVWDLTRSTAMVGLATLAMLGPEMLLAPFSGALADRHDRRRLLVVTHAMTGSLKVLIAGIGWLGGLSIWPLLGLVALVATASGVSQASAKAIVGSMVEEADLATAISLNSVLFNLAGFIGPVIAGAILGLSGPGAAFALSGLLSFAFLLAMRLVPAIPNPARREARFLDDLRAGAIYVWRDRFIGPLCLLHIASATLARPFMEFIPAMAQLFHQGGATLVGLLTSAVGFGAICGGLWLAQRNNSNGVMRVVLMAYSALAGLLLAFVWLRSLPVAMGVAALIGFSMIVRAAGMQTLLQSAADAAFRGRVMAVYMMILNGGSILGAVLIGFLAERIGLAWAFTLSVSLAMAVLLRLRAPLLAGEARRRSEHLIPSG